MNSIKAVMHQPRFANSKCCWISIDDEPIEIWFNNIVEEETLSLGFAQIWLAYEDLDKIAWDRISQLEDNTSTIVPILICSDDMDFDCVRIVVEQVVKDGKVAWTRVGPSVSHGLEIGATVKWQENTSNPIAVFDLNEFKCALADFQELKKSGS